MARRASSAAVWMALERFHVESRKTSVILWSCVAAAAGGVAAIVAVARWKHRTLVDSKVTSRLRDVQEVISDCYKKINEIEAHLPELLSSHVSRPARKLRASSNGTPVYES